MDQKGLSLTALIALIIGVTVVAVAGVLIAAGSFFSQSNPGQGGTPLSSAADLSGTWRTSFAATYYYATDDFSNGVGAGTLADVASESRQVTWVITPGADTNTVNIVQNYTSSNTQQLVDGGLYTPQPNWPDVNYTGEISSSSLTVKSGNTNVGYFTFTSSNISGAWDDDSLSGLYEEHVRTDANGLILTKQ
jgi:hypothetical protein